MRVHDGEGGIVADRADVAEMIGEPSSSAISARRSVRAWRRRRCPSAASTARAKAYA